MPVPLILYWRRSCRPSLEALVTWRILDSMSRRLFGRVPRAAPSVSTCRLNAKVVTEVTTGTLSACAIHCPQGATESAMT